MLAKNVAKNIVKLEHTHLRSFITPRVLSPIVLSLGEKTGDKLFSGKLFTSIVLLVYL